MVGQRRDVARPLAQRRDAQADHVEAEVQVLAEAAGGDLCRQVAVRGGEDAHVDAHRAAAAEAVDLALLDGAQQLGLQAGVHLADLVEQQRAAVGRLELAEAAGDGAAERALLVAEQLALQQVLGNGGAVQGHERTSSAARAAVDVAGEHLLAGAALPGDEHRGLGTRHLLGAPQRGEHRGVAGDQGVGLAGRGQQDGGDQLGVGGQRQELARPVAHRPDRGFGVGLGAAGDHGGGDALGGHRAHQAGHVMGDVAEHDVDTGVGAQPGEAGCSGVGLVETRTAALGDARGLTQLGGQGADDQDAHQPRSALTISVMVMPRRLSSTMTTSPRATRRLLT